PDFCQSSVYTAALPRKAVCRDGTQSDHNRLDGMIRFLEFLGNHPILSGLWLVLCAALLAYLKSKSARSVTPQQATMLVNRENGIVVDIRERKDYERGHIVDAINIPLAKLNE